MADRVDLKDKMVALFERPQDGEEAARELQQNGYSVEVLRGEEGRRRLDPDEDEGFFESLGNALQTLVGDEDRILDNVDEYLARGGAFIVTDMSEPSGGESASDVMRRHGGHYMWRFNDWTYVPVGGEE